jgi:hypothetical protein
VPIQGVRQSRDAELAALIVVRMVDSGRSIQGKGCGDWDLLYEKQHLNFWTISVLIQADLRSLITTHGSLQNGYTMSE